jgi:predicted HicB family RNase H-like nuclease
MAKRKTTQFNMRMDPELKEVAEKAAAADRRSLSSLIENCWRTTARFTASSSRSAKQDGTTEPLQC